MDFNTTCFFAFYIYNYLSFTNNNKRYKCKQCNNIYKLKEKQLAYYTSTRVSLILFLTSLFFNIILIKNKFNFENFENSVISNNLDIISQLCVLYFISYLTFDITVGHYHYKNSINLLEGYIHHIVYIFISLYIMYTNNTTLYTLFFIEEFPTFIRSLGSYNQKYRNDMLFGKSFFIFRILYHIILIYTCCIDKMSSIKILMPVALLTLGLHTYWWKTWLKKYYIKQEKSKPQEKSKSNPKSQEKVKQK